MNATHLANNFLPLEGEEMTGLRPAKTGFALTQALSEMTRLLSWLAGVGWVPWIFVIPQCCRGPSSARPGAQKPCAGKSWVAPVGMTEKEFIFCAYPALTRFVALRVRP